MAFQVPQQPRDPRVVLPAAPANPPVLANLYAAEKYKNVVLRSAASHRANRSTPNDVGRAMVYEHSITHTLSAAAPGPAVAPAWFGPVQLQLNALEQRSIRMERNIAKITNAANGDGTVDEFVVVPFLDGTDPTTPPNNLPRLTSIPDINVLSSANANRYLIGYGVNPIPNGVAARRRLVKLHIGCGLL